MQAVWEERAGLQPKNDVLRNNLALNLCNLASVEDDSAEALRLLHRALQLRQELWKQQPKNLELGYLVARTFQWIAEQEAERGHVEETRAGFMEAGKVLQTIIRADPGVAKYQRAWGELCLAIGREFTKLRRFEQAEAELAEARKVHLKNLESDPDLLTVPAQLTAATELIAVVYRELGRSADAVAAVRETGGALRLATGKSSANAQVRGHLADQFVQIAALERELGLMNDALATLVQDARPIASGPDPLFRSLLRWLNAWSSKDDDRSSHARQCVRRELRRRDRADGPPRRRKRVQRLCSAAERTCSVSFATTSRIRGITPAAPG